MPLKGVQVQFLSPAQMPKIESQIIPVQDTRKSLLVTPDRVIPDLILSREEAESLENMDGILGGDGEEKHWWDELRKPNWPPGRIEENRTRRKQRCIEKEEISNYNDY